MKSRLRSVCLPGTDEQNFAAPYLRCCSLRFATQLNVQTQVLEGEIPATVPAGEKLEDIGIQLLMADGTVAGDIPSVRAVVVCCDEVPTAGLQAVDIYGYLTVQSPVKKVTANQSRFASGSTLWWTYVSF